MANQLFTQMNQQNQLSQNNGIGQMLNMMKGSNNPNMMINMLAQKNPQIAGIMQMLNSSGMSPKDLFFQQAKAKGINPQDIINQLK